MNKKKNVAYLQVSVTRWKINVNSNSFTEPLHLDTPLCGESSSCPETRSFAGCDSSVADPVPARLPIVDGVESR